MQLTSLRRSGGPTLASFVRYIIPPLVAFQLVNPGMASASQTSQNMAEVRHQSVIAAPSGAALPGPEPLSPASNLVAIDGVPTLSWALPAGATQVRVQVSPATGDGPGLDMVLGPVSWYTLPAPPDWYGLLPDMTYNWRVRAGIGGLWTAWSAEMQFRTAAVSSDSIQLGGPTIGAVVSGPAMLQWSDANPTTWLYEVQASKDPNFVTDPAAASAAVYWEMLHGGVTSPRNSYTLASAYLEPASTYYWRVRPRVQGDGSPVAWSGVASFQTPVPAPPPSAPAPVAPVQPADSGFSPSAVEQEVIAAVNGVRAQYGLRAVTINSQLTAAARRHSADMANGLFMSHVGSDGSTFDQRISDSGYPWTRAGEIVAFGYKDSASVTTAWMNSPGHRAIIMTAEYREAGAGVVQAANGRLYWTIDWGTR